MFYSKNLKKYKNLNHCFFKESDFQEAFTKASIVEGLK